jgi:2,4-dienoyl-CoA reductase-like NADH-dependent reductase (Old Yellow Enzyme family)
MSVLFETTTIGNMQLANRFVRSATGMGMGGEGGACTPGLIDVMAELARGGVGLIITGFAYVQPNGVGVPGMIGCHNDSSLPGLTKMQISTDTALS